MSDEEQVREIRATAIPLGNDLGELLDRIGGERFVLIGEATHGTREFYYLRAKITQELIRHKGFRLVVIEGDWPDVLRLHRFARGKEGDDSVEEAMENFSRFPRWMWRNEEMKAFVAWLRGWNREFPEGATGLFGMDLYSMHASMDEVLRYLRKADPVAAKEARERYSCFDHFGTNPQEYGFATTSGQRRSCEKEVIEQLMAMRKPAPVVSREMDREERFYAEQNARVVADAENYYRAMFRGRHESWNLRDRHMADTVDELAAFSGGNDEPAKVVVWAHNSHVGDARATRMGRQGEWNVGQILRQRHPREVFIIGFSTHCGTVIAAHEWDGEAERMAVRPALAGSYERLFHDVGVDRFWLDLREDGAIRRILGEPRLERAVGVIYRPETERWSHYFEATLPEQFDVVIHLDRTRALSPLDDVAKPAKDRPCEPAAEL